MLNAEFHKHNDFAQALRGGGKMLNVASLEYVDTSWDAYSFEYQRDDSRKTLRYRLGSKVKRNGLTDSNMLKSSTFPRKRSTRLSNNSKW